MIKVCRTSIIRWVILTWRRSINKKRSRSLLRLILINLWIPGKISMGIRCHQSQTDSSKTMKYRFAIRRTCRSFWSQNAVLIWQPKGRMRKISIQSHQFKKLGKRVLKSVQRTLLGLKVIKFYMAIEIRVKFSSLNSNFLYLLSLIMKMTKKLIF